VDTPSRASSSTVRHRPAAAPLAAYLKTPAWARGDGPDADVVLAARARLARNLASFPFPGRADERDLRRVAQEVRRAALADTERLADLSPVAIARLSARDKADLVDARRISPELADGGANRWALLDDSGALSVFINEEDHVRIQALAAGNAAADVLRAGQDAEQRLARRLSWAADARWGYLTASLSNLGTGLRLSLLVHLPALAFLQRLPETLRAAHHLGISIRGAHGEHSCAAGDLYQVSNAVTFGLGPPHIAGRVRPVADYLIAAERAARREAVDGHAARVVEAARGAWTRIERADRLAADVALDLLSGLRLAAAVDLTPLGGHAPAPDAALFAAVVAELRTGAGLAARGGGAPPSVQDAIQRPAKIRTALRHFYRNKA
jgi:protein arginine kinase